MADIQIFKNMEAEGAKKKKKKNHNIANQKFNFDICTVRNLQNIFMEHDLYLIS